MAGYLVDSDVFLWASESPARLTPAERTILRDAGADIVLSVASIWELSIKWTIGRLQIPGGRRAISPSHFADSATLLGFPVLPVEPPEAEYIRHLPAIHGDPFDRLIIAQALLGQRTVVTRDAVFARYPGVRVLAPQ